MSYKQQAVNQRTYIPPQIASAMNQQVQSRMPAHLQKYMSSGYVPAHAQKQIENHLQKTMPTHLKQYAGAYVEQQIVQPSVAAPPSTPGRGPGPTPDHLRLDHSASVGTVQYEAKLRNNLFGADPSQPTTPAAFARPGEAVNPAEPSGAEQPAAPAATPAPTPAPTPTQSGATIQEMQAPAPDVPEPDPHTGGYDFITNPVKPKRHWSLPGAGSWPKRLLLVGGALVVLLIIVNVGKTLFSAGNKQNTQALVSVLQDQHELIHLCANALLPTSGQAQLSLNTINFAVTTQASMVTASQTLTTYLLKNHTKVNAKSLFLKEDSTTDATLKAAFLAGNFEPTFEQTLQTKINIYQQDLRSAYPLATGPKGRQLLASDLNNLQLLKQMLATPSP